MRGTAALVFSAIVVVLLCRTVRVVPPGQVFVVELLRRYRRLLEPGLRVVIPLLESVRAEVPVGEQQADVGPVLAITADDLVAEVSVSVHHRVSDPVRATYEIHDRAAGVEASTGYVVRDLAGSMTLDQMRGSLHHTTARLTEMLDERLAAFGVKVVMVEITGIAQGSRPDGRH